MTSEEDLGGAELLSRVHLLLEAVVVAPGDASLLESAAAQAAVALDADSVVLGTMSSRDALHAFLWPGVGGAMHEIGALQVESRFPLTDAIVRGEPIWLSSPSEIRAFYPYAGGLWGRAFAAVPLMVRQQPVGALGVIYDRGGHYFTGPERAFLGAIADICAIMVSDVPTLPWTTDAAHRRSLSP